MRYFSAIAVAICIFAAACGSDGDDYDFTVPTQTYPYVNRINPAAATAGDVVTIFGHGFSDAPEFNIVVIDGNDVFADTYTLLAAPTANEIESITFTVPVGIAAGPHTIYVIVGDNPSNTNLSITIN